MQLKKGGADAALVVGDMVVRADVSTVSAVTGFLCRLANRIPVFYALGNHEYEMLLNRIRPQNILLMSMCLPMPACAFFIMSMCA